MVLYSALAKIYTKSIIYKGPIIRSLFQPQLITDKEKKPTANIIAVGPFQPVGLSVVNEID